MACCGSSAGGGRLGKILFSVVMLAWSVPLSLLLWPFSLIPGGSVLKKFSISISQSFAAGLSDALGRPLLGGNLHCSLSGRLLNRSPLLASAVYHHFNVMLLLVLIALAVALLVARGLVV